MMTSVGVTLRAAATLVVLICMCASATATKLVPQDRGQLSFSYAPLVKAVAPAVVNVYAARAVARPTSPFAGDPFFENFFGADTRPRERMARSLGSGVVVAANGLIVTNVHVVKGADELRIATKDGREFAAELILADEDSDIAILRTRDAADLDYLELGNSDALEVGDLVLAIGNPFGVGQTVTSGIVSGLARTKVGTGNFGFFIQTDAAINPGNSGGALVGMNGRLVGINTAIFTRSGGSNGIGFAVPSNMVKVVLDSAIRGAERVERPYFGASFEQVSFEVAEALGLKRPVGALVVEVEEGGPAAMAGLRSGDVVLAFDGRPIEHLDALGYRLVTAGPGKEVRLSVLSRNERRTVSLRLAKPKPVAAPVLIGGRSPFGGVSVSNLAPDIARRLQSPTDGVLVVAVERGSPAARTGLRPLDVIVRLNGKPIGDPTVLEAAARSRPRRWVLDLVRNGQMLRTILR